MENNQYLTTTSQSEKKFLPETSIHSLTGIVNVINETKSIAVMRKENDLNQVRTIIHAATMDVFDYYRETYSENDIIILAEQIMDIGYNLNGLDFGLFKTNCIKGIYKNRVDIIDGKPFKISFFRLTPDVFIDWLKVYIAERGEAFINENLKSHVITKNNMQYSDKTITLLKEVSDKSKISQEADIPVASDWETIQKNRFNLIVKDFEKLWKDQGCKYIGDEWDGTKYVVVNNKRMLRSEYLEIMF